MPARHTPNRTTPTVSVGTLYPGAEDAGEPIAVGGAAWLGWLAAPGHTTFYFADPGGSFTARRETRRGQDYWYAYRKQGGTLRKTYLGKAADLTLARLREAATALAADDASPYPEPPGGEKAPAEAAPAPSAPGPGPAGAPGEGESPLLAAKLRIPAVPPGRVPRPALLARLGALWEHALTLVVAPAGFGKTTLIGGWAAEQRRPVAWVSLDAGDRDPARFRQYLFAALARLLPVPGPGKAAPPRGSIAQLTRLLNDWPAQAGDCALVLDDYHFADAPAAHELLTFLIDHLPPGLHVLIASRGEPPLPLGRWRVRGQVLELGASDLRFTRPEAAAFLTGTMRLPLAPEAIAALEAHTEGWVAGLQLAALRLRGAGSAGSQANAGPPRPGDDAGPAEPRLGSDRLVVDYVVQEVLQQQPPPTRRFLLLTAALERLSGPLCDAVTGDAGGAAHLAALERANLFLVPLDAERQWYRYHPLFAEALRAHLARTDPARIPEIHRRASAWHETAGQPADAVEHALLGADWPRAVRLIAPLGPALAGRGELRTLQRWMETLPEAVLQASPDLCVWYAWVLLFNRHVDACALPLRAAEAGWTATGATARLGEVATLRSAIAYFRGDVAGTIAEAREALARLGGEPSFQRAVATLYLCHGHLQAGDVAAARAALATVPVPDPVQSGAPLAETSIVEDMEMFAAKLAVLTGDLPQAARRCHALLARDRLDTRRAAITAHLWLAMVLREWNDLETALHHARQTVDLCRQTEEGITLPSAHLVLARVLAAQGAGPQALEAFDLALEEAGQVGAQQAARQAAAHRARLLATLGRWAEANGWARGCELSPDTVPGYERQGEWLTVARLRIGQGQAGRVVRGLRACLRAAEVAGRQGDAVEILAVLALAYQASGLWDRAAITLEQALALAAPGGYVRVFLDEGPAMAALLGRVSGSATAPAYVHVLLAAFGAASGAPGNGPGLSADLSAREQDVLHLLAAGASNAEIAAALGITVNTVKKHLGHLYGKLEVTTRGGAVAQARQRDLLPAKDGL